MSYTFFGPLKRKNVAYLFSDRSRALAHAYVLKKVCDILFLIKKIGLYFFDFSIKMEGNY